MQQMDFLLLELAEFFKAYTIQEVLGKDEA